MIKYKAGNPVAVESVDFFQKERNCLENPNPSVSVSRLVQDLEH